MADQSLFRLFMFSQREGAWNARSASEVLALDAAQVSCACQLIVFKHSLTATASGIKDLLLIHNG